MGLSDIEIKASYETYIDDPVQDFYIPALSHSVAYDRIAGFFSSSSLAIAARGIGALIDNGGKMRLLACPKLNNADIETIKKAIENPEEYLDDILASELDYIEDKFQQDHLEALGWLLANGHLEIRIVLVTNHNNVSYEDLFHQKVGILKDADGNVLTFSGSVNESASGWLKNVEEFKVFKSWNESSKEWIDTDLKKFDEFWNNERPYVMTVSLPDAVKEDLVQRGSNFARERLIAQRYIEKSKGRDADELSLFSYQKRAVSDWADNGMRMLFEMATGTGKTRTAIASSKKLIDEVDRLVVVVATPQNTITRQWRESYRDLNIDFDAEIFADSSNQKWKKEFEKSLSDVEAGFVDSLVIYTTHATASSDFFIAKMDNIGNQVKVLFIGDETHALGAPKQRKALLERYDYRIGLSATPNRWFDDEGSRIIRQYYNEHTFSFSISDALQTINPLTGKTFLTPYEYIPIKIGLDSQELTEYAALSKKISRAYAMNESALSDDSYYQNLLFKRSNLLKNAAGKIPKFLSIAKAMQNFRDAIVFVSPEQIDSVCAGLNQLGIVSHRFTENQGTKLEERYGGISEREYLINCFSDGDYQALVAISCLDEGIDIPSANTAFLLSNSTNPREYVQRIGRVIRRSPKKEIAYIYDFICIPESSWVQNDSERILEEKLITKECERVEEMSRNARNRGEIASFITSVWEDFYNGCK